MKANNTVFLGLGTNIGNLRQNLNTALDEISQIARISQKSSIYETEPVGYQEQNNFLNMVIEIETALSPVDLIIRLQEIEHKMGKNREIENGPRIIDLDILMYNNEIIDLPGLKIPHPRLHQRNFVLEPFAEISGNILHPILKKNINTLRQNIKYPTWIRKK
ncbi:2-amino-4-hydroxy-6-hydroxymethyldihydropteridine diphosphokinase [Candidatus Peregrinibacteria bacterium]|nr:2-amino-4-hydroxy-6-hydroxymethyldihydropteridine diphosphokinase [Candidatus Peregrinibacteria bacterium]